MTGTTLVNKGNTWKSNDEWRLIPKSSKFYIENTLKNSVLGIAFRSDKVIGKKLIPHDPRQLWKKGKTDKDGYYTLKNHKSHMALIAISDSGLAIEGVRIIGTKGKFQIFLDVTDFTINVFFSSWPYEMTKTAKLSLICAVCGGKKLLTKSSKGAST